MRKLVEVPLDLNVDTAEPTEIMKLIIFLSKEMGAKLLSSVARSNGPANGITPEEEFGRRSDAVNEVCAGVRALIDSDNEHLTGDVLLGLLQAAIMEMAQYLESYYAAIERAEAAVADQHNPECTVCAGESAQQPEESDVLDDMEALLRDLNIPCGVPVNPNAVKKGGVKHGGH